MRNILKINVLVIICFLLSQLSLAELAYAGAWTLPKGKSYLELYNKYYIASYDYDADGNKARKANDGRYTERLDELKYEYGVTDNFGLLGSIGFKDIRYKDDPSGSTRTDDHTTGIGDLWLRGKQRFTNEDTGDPITSSLLLGGKFPLGYDRNNAQPRGTGYIDGELRLLLGKKLPKINCYLGAESGIYLKKGPYANYIPYLFEAGWQMTERFMLKGMISGIETPSTWTGTEEDYAVWNVFLVYSRKGEQLPSVYREQQVGFNIELGYGETFDGRNTGKGTEYLVNINCQY